MPPRTKCWNLPGPQIQGPFCRKMLQARIFNRVPFYREDSPWKMFIKRTCVRSPWMSCFVISQPPTLYVFVFVFRGPLAKSSLICQNESAWAFPAQFSPLLLGLDLFCVSLPLRIRLTLCPPLQATPSPAKPKPRSRSRGTETETETETRQVPPTSFTAPAPAASWRRPSWTRSWSTAPCRKMLSRARRRPP